jgi:hypothetical protein
MKRILFLVLWTMLISGGAHAQGAIEIYVDGHRYGSFEAYLASKRSVKGFQKDKNDLSDPTRHKLYVMSVENGMVDALSDFYQNWALARRIAPEQLQEAIAQAVADSKGPKFLIASPGKVRIMTLAPDNSVEK